MKIRSTWIPYSGAWFSAVLLFLLTGAISGLERVALKMGLALSEIFPKFVMQFNLLALLMPILLIAIAHHYLHLFLDHFFPHSPTDKQQASMAFFPGLISWWEGFYGWSIILLATLITAKTQSTLAPLTPFFCKQTVVLYPITPPSKP